MSIVDDYQRQFGWRSWSTVLDALPSLVDSTVLDLGCGVGDLADALVTRGARVIGIDGNEQLLDAARARGLAKAEFRKADLLAPLDVDTPMDGIWCSFAAAYLPDPIATLAAWRTLLRPGGWIALTEIDDLFGHEPLDTRARTLLDDYARDARSAGRYDFHRGRRLGELLGEAGFAVQTTLILEDRELSFEGPALPDVVVAWRARLDRMKLLQEFCGAEFESVRDAFLDSLTRPEHRSDAKVHSCIATA